MPMQYVEPEVAFEITDPTRRTWIIYHVYKNNMMDERQTFWYTTDISESEASEFDIRDVLLAPCNIRKWMSPLQRVGVNSHHVGLQMAFNMGLASFTDKGELVFATTTLAQRA